MSGIQWLGQPGHFAGSKHCRWHLHTRIGQWRVSSIGEYCPGDPMVAVRLNAPLEPPMHYQTMVFRLDEHGEVSDWSGEDREYFASRDEAAAGHYQHIEVCAGLSEQRSGPPRARLSWPIFYHQLPPGYGPAEDHIREQVRALAEKRERSIGDTIRAGHAVGKVPRFLWLRPGGSEVVGSGDSAPEGGPWEVLGPVTPEALAVALGDDNGLRQIAALVKG